MAQVTLNNNTRYEWDGRTIRNCFNPNIAWRFDGRELCEVNNPVNRYLWDGKTLSPYAGSLNENVNWDGRFMSKAFSSDRIDFCNKRTPYRNGNLALADSDNIHPVAWMVILGLVH